jgi:hypothetical protein
MVTDHVRENQVNSTGRLKIFQIFYGFLIPWIADYLPYDLLHVHLQRPISGVGVRGAGPWSDGTGGVTVFRTKPNIRPDHVKNITQQDDFYVIDFGLFGVADNNSQQVGKFFERPGIKLRARGSVGQMDVAQEDYHVLVPPLDLNLYGLYGVRVTTVEDWLLLGLNRYGSRMLRRSGRVLVPTSGSSHITCQPGQCALRSPAHRNDKPNMPRDGVQHYLTLISHDHGLAKTV